MFSFTRTAQMDPAGEAKKLQNKNIIAFWSLPCKEVLTC